MNKNDSKTACSNCKYFRRHYIVDDMGTLFATARGHCVHLKINNGVSAKHVRKDEGCELWQPYELQKLKIKYGMEQRLQNISDKVGEMLAVLREME